MKRATVPLAVAGLVWAMVAPAHAGPPTDRGPDRASSQSAPPSEPESEDTDSNDGGTPNNVPDDGDDAHPSGKDRSVEPGRAGNQGNTTSDPDDDGRGPDRSNGGADRPDGPGGTDLADQDGNNGCGNDDDFEDDNEGRCLGRQGAPGQQRDTSTEAQDPAFQSDTDGPDVDQTHDSEVGGDPAGPDRSETVIRPETIEPEGTPRDGEAPAERDAVVEEPVTLADVLAGRAVRDVYADTLRTFADRSPQADVLGDTVTRPRNTSTAGGSSAGGWSLPITGAGLLTLVAIGLALGGAGTIAHRLGRPGSSD